MEENINKLYGRTRGIFILLIVVLIVQVVITGVVVLMLQYGNFQLFSDAASENEDNNYVQQSTSSSEQSASSVATTSSQSSSSSNSNTAKSQVDLTYEVVDECKVAFNYNDVNYTFTKDDYRPFLSDSLSLSGARLNLIADMFAEGDNGNVTQEVSLECSTDLAPEQEVNVADLLEELRNNSNNQGANVTVDIVKESQVVNNTTYTVVDFQFDSAAGEKTSERLYLTVNNNKYYVIRVIAEGNNTYDAVLQKAGIEYL